MKNTQIVIEYNYQYFIIGVRISVFETALEDGIVNSLLSQHLGADYLSCFLGFDQEEEQQQPDDFPFYSSVYGAMKIKEKVDIPVFANYQIFDAETAETVLQQAEVDMVVMGHTILANPNLPDDVMHVKTPVVCHNCDKCMWKSVNVDRCPARNHYK